MSKYEIGQEVPVGGIITITGLAHIKNGNPAYNTDRGVVMPELLIERLEMKPLEKAQPEQPRREDKPTYKSGDKVKVIGNGNPYTHYAPIGSIQRVVEVTGTLVVVGYCGQAISFADIEPYTEPESTEPKQEPVKLYCVKDYEPGEWLTKGKVYTTDAENMFTFDDGFRDVCAGHGIAGFTGFIKRNPIWKNHLVPLVHRPAKVGEWVRNSETGEVCEVIALSFGKNTYVRTKVGNKTYNGCCADRKIEHPFDFLLKTDYLVLDGYKPEPEKAESEYYSGKVVCVDSAGYYHTVGKTYTVVDGFLIDDSGTKVPYLTGPVTSVDDLNSRSACKFAVLLDE